MKPKQSLAYFSFPAVSFSEEEERTASKPNNKPSFHKSTNTSNNNNNKTTTKSLYNENIDTCNVNSCSNHNDNINYNSGGSGGGGRAKVESKKSRIFIPQHIRKSSINTNFNSNGKSDNGAVCEQVTLATETSLVILGGTLSSSDESYGTTRSTDSWSPEEVYSYDFDTQSSSTSTTESTTTATTCTAEKLSTKIMVPILKRNSSLSTLPQRCPSPMRKTTRDEDHSSTSSFSPNHSRSSSSSSSSFNLGKRIPRQRNQNSLSSLSSQLKKVSFSRFIDVQFCSSPLEYDRSMISIDPIDMDEYNNLLKSLQQEQFEREAEFFKSTISPRDPGYSGDSED